MAEWRAAWFNVIAFMRVGAGDEAREHRHSRRAFERVHRRRDQGGPIDVPHLDAVRQHERRKHAGQQEVARLRKYEQSPAVHDVGNRASDEYEEKHRPELKEAEESKAERGAGDVPDDIQVCDLPHLEGDETDHEADENQPEFSERERTQRLGPCDALLAPCHLCLPVRRSSHSALL